LVSGIVAGSKGERGRSLISILEAILLNHKIMKEFKRTTVTAALIYANGPIHIGHIAGCYLPADIYVRYLRATGQDVKFISGTDEHGVPITIKAKKEGVTPQEVVDKYYKIIKDSFEEFGISFDIYSRNH
jgi:methionyl-tRNA synthetase